MAITPKPVPTDEELRDLAQRYIDAAVGAGTVRGSTIEHRGSSTKVGVLVVTIHYDHEEEPR